MVCKPADRTHPVSSVPNPHPPNRASPHQLSASALYKQMHDVRVRYVPDKDVCATYLTDLVAPAAHATATRGYNVDKGDMFGGACCLSRFKHGLHRARSRSASTCSWHTKSQYQDTNTRWKGTRTDMTTTVMWTAPAGLQWSRRIRIQRRTELPYLIRYSVFTGIRTETGRR